MDESEKGWFKDKKEEVLQDTITDLIDRHDTDIFKEKMEKEVIIKHLEEEIMVGIEKIDDRLQASVTTSELEKIEDSLQGRIQHLTKLMDQLLTQLKEYAVLYPPLQKEVLKYTHYAQSLEATLNAILHYEGMNEDILPEWEKNKNELKHVFEDIRLSFLGDPEEKNTKPISLN